jgi:CRP-like cAMP-binding protein
VSNVARSPYRNEILAALPGDELAVLLPLLSRVEWANGQPLQERNEPIEQMYFAESGFASTVAEANGGVEVGLAGRETLIGLLAAFDPHAIAFNRVFVQTAGSALRVSASHLRENIHEMPALRSLLLRSHQAQMAQNSQTAACNVRHGVTERLARWLLLAHDRTDGDELLLTQRFVSDMLAVRRVSVTKAANVLRDAGAVENHRGRIVITDRLALEAKACDCYARVRAFIALISDMAK